MSIELRQVRLAGYNAVGFGSDEWNPLIVLLRNQIGIEINTRRIKIGDATHTWQDLPYSQVDLDDVIGLADELNAKIALTNLSSSATGLTYTNTTGVFSLTSGYVIPTTTDETNWDTAYNERITTLTTTGSSGAATLIGNTLNIPQYAGSTGTVTTVSVTSANGFAGTVANATTTPSITLSTSITGVLKGDGTAISAATAGTDYQSPVTLTVTGSSGAATFVSNTLNIPTYTLSGLGGISASSNDTLTNKRITSRVVSDTSNATPAINTDNCDFYELTAQAVNITSMSTNLTGTPTNRQILTICIKGTAARTISWGASFASTTIILPTTTVTTEELKCTFVYSTARGVWEISGLC